MLVAAGIALGLAVAVKATAVVVLPFAVLAALPPGSPLRALWRPAALLAAGAAAAAGVASLASGRGLGWVAGLLRSGDTVAWTSPSTAVGLTVELVTGADAVGITRVIGVLLLAVVLPLLWWQARGGGALPGAGLALAATVLCAPVFHPWYAIWPLAVLAATSTGTATAIGTAAGTSTATAAASSNTGSGLRPARDEESQQRWLLGLCALAATLTLPAGYNWALFTRVPGAIVVTAVLVALAFRQVRKLRHRKVFA